MNFVIFAVKAPKEAFCIEWMASNQIVKERDKQWKRNLEAERLLMKFW
jgi:hypothetical protein